MSTYTSRKKIEEKTGAKERRNERVMCERTGETKKNRKKENRGSAKGRNNNIRM